MGINLKSLGTNFLVSFVVYSATLIIIAKVYLACGHSFMRAETVCNFISDNFYSLAMASYYDQNVTTIDMIINGNDEHMRFILATIKLFLLAISYLVIAAGNQIFLTTLKAIHQKFKPLLTITYNYINAQINRAFITVP